MIGFLVFSNKNKRELDKFNYIKLNFLILVL